MGLQGVRCDVAEGDYRLHVAGLSAAEGVSLLDPQQALRVRCFGATGYERYGWATEKDLPSLGSVVDLQGLVARPGLGLLELEVELLDFGGLTSHDDSSCSFRVNTRGALLALMNALFPAAHAGRSIHTLLSNSGVYFAWSEAGGLARSPEPTRRRAVKRD